jgi:nucleotide-binding universal stress UspA family protein
MFSKILCPVDLSENSVKALQWTEFLARKYNSEVVVLHVIESLSQSQVDLDYPRFGMPSRRFEFLAPLNAL